MQNKCKNITLFPENPWLLALLFLALGKVILRTKKFSDVYYGEAEGERVIAIGILMLIIGVYGFFLYFRVFTKQQLFSVTSVLLLAPIFSIIIFDIIAFFLPCLPFRLVGIVELLSFPVFVLCGHLHYRYMLKFF